MIRAWLAHAMSRLINVLSSAAAEPIGMTSGARLRE
jgi:hypothetical protein